MLSPLPLLLSRISGSTAATSTTTMAASAAAFMPPLGELRGCISQRLSRSSYTFHIALQLLQRLFVFWSQDACPFKVLQLVNLAL